MYKFGYVILHYKTIDDTEKCVDSIFRIDKNAMVVVVDNGSCNGTGEKLRTLFYSNNHVHVIMSDENLGFAKGNNLGISYIREFYNPDFIVVLNNDTEIVSGDFCGVVSEEYNTSRFFVLGPQIITLDGEKKSNPVEHIAGKKIIVIKLIVKKLIKLIFNIAYLGFLFNDVGKKSSYVGIYDHDRRYENVKLHGSCWIFSKEYFEIYDGINKSTFLYFEEDILYLQTVKKGLKTVYNPKLVIYHKEDSATNSIAKSNRHKNIFVLSNEIKSLCVLYKILD